jgi:hypothetical protein
MQAVAIDYMAKQLDVEPIAISNYDWQGQTGKRYGGCLRTALGVRPATADDFKAVETWLREDVVPWDDHLRHLQDAMLEWYRSRPIEPPTAGRMEHLVRSTVHTHEAEICAGTAAKHAESAGCTHRFFSPKRRSRCRRGFGLAQYHVQCPEDRSGACQSQECAA